MDTRGLTEKPTLTGLLCGSSEDIRGNLHFSKMGIKQLLVVLRTVLTASAKNQDNGLEADVFKAPVHLLPRPPLWLLNLMPSLFLPSKSHASEAINEF